MTYADRRYQDDEPLALDQRRERAPEPPPRRSGPAPVTLMISVLLLGGVVGGAAWLYRDGARAPNGPPKIIGQAVGPVRAAAPPQAQEADPAAGLSIYKSDPDNAAAPAYVPPPEQPAARAAAAAEPAAPPAAVVASAPPLTSAPLAPPKKPDKAPTIDSLLAQADAKPAKVKATAPGTKADTLDKISASLKSADTPAKPKPDAKLADAKGKTDAKTKSPAAAGGPAVVQIGAFSSEDLARKAFHEAAAKGDASGKAMRLTPVDKDGQTLWRVAMTGFSDKESADAVCGRLKAAGRSCFVR